MIDRKSGDRQGSLPLLLHQSDDLNADNVKIKIFQQDPPFAAHQITATFSNKTLILHTLAAVMLGIPLAVLFLSVLPRNTGFFLDDQNIAYPFLNHETVSTTTAFLIVAVVPFPLFLVLHLFILCDKITNKETQKYLLMIFVKYFFLLAAVNLFTEFMKDLTARKRPDFLGRCMPSFDEEISFDTFVFAEDVCTNLDEKIVIKEGFSSFPSGHASNLFFFSVFFSLYFQKQLSYFGEQMKLVVGFIQVGLIIFAIWVCETRLYDNVHHAFDVISGAVVGTVIAVYGIYYIFSAEFLHKQCLMLLSQMSQNIVNEMKDNEKLPPAFAGPEAEAEAGAEGSDFFWSLQLERAVSDQFGTWIQPLVWKIKDDVLYQTEGRSIQKDEAVSNAYQQLYEFLRKSNKKT